MQNTVLGVVQQAMMEMGLPKPNEAVASSDPTVQQVLALLNSAGMEIVLGYPWEQLTREFLFLTQENDEKYPLPADWNYFLDQTQWDRTNHWPLLGPKTAQEWQWLKGGLLSSGPRIRYRVVGGQLEVFPKPGPDQNWQIAMEYVSKWWLKSTTKNNTFYDTATDDTDVFLIDPWLAVKFTKLKYWEAKGLNTQAYTKDFMGLWESKLGKNKGAPVLTLAPRARTMLIGVNNIPDGSWNVGNGNTV
jgi:hypothetical protein